MNITKLSQCGRNDGRVLFYTVKYGKIISFYRTCKNDGFRE